MPHCVYIRSVWPLGHVAKPKPCAPVFGGSAGGLLGGEQRRPGNAEQPGDARSASPNLLITHFTTKHMKPRFFDSLLDRLTSVLDSPFFNFFAGFLAGGCAMAALFMRAFSQ